jgi:ADP-heptose:LPS heptosyltransferase
MADSREFAKWFYTQKVPHPQHSVHVLDYYFALLGAAGIDAAPPHRVQFKVPETAAAAVRQKLKNAQTAQNYFVLIPGSAHADKCWPADRFAKLAEHLHQQYNADVVLVGTQNDKLQTRAIAAQSAFPLIDLTAQTSLPELIALLQNTRGVVSNDTGPGYIAAETCGATVIIYGNVNPARVAPYRRPECIAAVEPDNRPAAIRSTDPAHDIKNVTFDAVRQKLNALLTDKPINKP